MMSNYPRLDSTGLSTLVTRLANVIKQAHTIVKTNPSTGTTSTMPHRGNLQFDGLNVEDNSTSGSTLIKGQAKVCPDKATWDSMSAAEKNDPNTYWFLPWADSTPYASDKAPVGTVISVAVDTSLIPSGQVWYPTEDYLICNGATLSIADYPLLADYFQTAYGDSQYFGGTGTNFMLPNWSLDFPSNGLLAIKAQVTSNLITIADVDDSTTSSTKVWSSTKVNSEISQYIPRYITLSLGVASTSQTLTVPGIDSSFFPELLFVSAPGNISTSQPGITTSDSATNNVTVYATVTAATDITVKFQKGILLQQDGN